MTYRPRRDRNACFKNTPAKLALLTLLSATLATAAVAQTAPAKQFSAEGVPVKVEQLASGLENPWSVEALPDNGGYLVTERPGRLRLVKDGKLSQPITGLPKISAGGQGGLLDLALDPKFSANRTLYFTASIAGDGGRGTAVFSAVLAADGKNLASVKQLFAMNRFTDAGQHFGSRIAVTDDGKLFFGIGDRGDGKRAQDKQDHAGAILRINTDGSIPKDNPYASGKDALPELWSKGHRNPQGITIDPETGTLYTVEHGARGGDEINIPAAGKNYGWPVITYGINYNGAKIGEGTAKPGLEQPVHYWDPSLAPGAIAVYRGKMFPEWNGDFLVAALKFKLLSRLDRDAGGKVVSEKPMLKDAYGRVRDVAVAPDGAVLVVTDESDGALLRLSRGI
jgi:glucose/arabinose dehydrogenase